MTRSTLDHALAVLKALHVEEVVYRLDGGGDSGNAELEDVVFADGCQGKFPTVTIGFADNGQTVDLSETLLDLVYDVPEFDWINNEGGCGTVTLRPQEEDPALRVDCDMTCNDDDDGGPDFEDDEEFASPDFNETDPAIADGAIAVDDSALQPRKGENQ